MKIVVHDGGEDSRDIKIVLPTGMIFNPVTAMIVAPLINKTLDGKRSKQDVDKAVEMAEELADDPDDFPTNAKIRRRDIIRFCNEINRMKRIHKEMPLVEVLEDDGGSVTIWL